MAQQERPSKAKEEKRLDDTVAESFPASDPPANSGITGVRRWRPNEPQKGKRPPSHARDENARPTGHPS